MNIHRRGFIAGLGALFAAPAIIRPGILMPVKPFLSAAPVVETADGLSAMLTPNIIAHEAARLFRETMLRRGGCSVTMADAHNQLHADFKHSSQDLLLSLPEFSKRYIAPAVTALAWAIPLGARVSGRKLPLPEGVDFAVSEKSGNVPMRVLRAYDVLSDEFITRFDVVHA